MRLYATLASFAPSQTAGMPFVVELEDGLSVLSLIEHIGLPPADVHLCIVNGRLAHDRMTRLMDQDRVGLFPPVGGG